jgi:hypothetical protein
MAVGYMHGSRLASLGCQHWRPSPPHLASACHLTLRRRDIRQGAHERVTIWDPYGDGDVVLLAREEYWHRAREAE